MKFKIDRILKLHHFQDLLKTIKEDIMKRRSYQIIFFILLFVFHCSFGAAQRTTETGILDGIVTYEQGERLPGVTVTVFSPALMLPQVSVVTKTDGFYRITQLPVGSYKVIFEIDGFKKVIIEKVKVNLGRTTRLDITMQPTEIQETV